MDLHALLHLLLAFAHLRLEDLYLLVRCQAVAESVRLQGAIFAQELTIMGAVGFDHLLDVVVFARLLLPLAGEAAEYSDALLTAELAA